MNTFNSKMLAFITSPRGWLVLLMLFHLCANIWWLWVDNHPIMTDEETHMIMARDYYNALFPRVGDQGVGARLAAMGRIKADVGNPVHPPLLHIAGAVLTRLVGYSVDRLAFVNTLSFLLALAGVFLLARLFLSEEESFYATLVFSFTPMIYTSSRYFMTDFLSMALVIWVIYALLRSNWFTNFRFTAVFGIVSGLALMTRTTVVLYYFLPSVLAFGIGVLGLFDRGKGRFRFNQSALGRLAFNLAVMTMFTLVIASPWYIAHGGQFYRHWMKPQQGGAGAPIAILRYQAPAVPQPPVARERAAEAPSDEIEVVDTSASEQPHNASESAAATPPTADTSARKTASSGRWRFLVNRRIDWIRYPVFVINNAVFLPMFIMSLAGMVLCFGCARFRKSIIPWFLVCWLLGSYYLLTMVLSFATPRYAMQALPALALLSVFPILALPKGKIRLVAQFVYAGVLLFQYGNLTVHAYGPLAEIKIPVVLDQKYQKVYDDPGLYLYKSVLHASSAYGRMQAPMKENFKDRLFFAMLQEEHKRPFYGVEANYARLNIRGMIFDQEHFWLDVNAPNPFRRTDIPLELLPYRNFRHYGWGREIDNILPVINIVDYVAYTTEGVTSEKEQEWLRILEQEGFELVDRFYEERYGQVSASYYGLLARVPKQELPKADSLDDLRKLNLEQLYQLRHSARFSRFSSDMQESLTRLLRAMFEKTGKSLPLNDSVDFKGVAINHERGDLFSLSMILHVHKPVSIHYRMMFRGAVGPKFMASHFNSLDGKAGVFRWNFDPSPTPPLWPADDFVLLRFPINVRPIPYKLSFAFYTAQSGVWGDAVDLGQIDFSTIPRNPE